MSTKTVTIEESKLDALLQAGNALLCAFEEVGSDGADFGRLDHEWTRAEREVEEVRRASYLQRAA